ncbi:hypothetical protein [Sphingomonas abietis]|uniref:DUF222 domain-containing protein n=1 Tax=Sphingomonas abietis TaxID=3012344 RepID=A0ABY7NR16_9SPHN|nr:hypothetical protein [Sphingomonas abietis]WBO23981.1 hypothetical protein PBT88_07680 [Sphingomonas abietis]
MIDAALHQRAVDALLALPAIKAGDTEQDSAALCASTVLGVAAPEISRLKMELEKAERDAKSANADADMYARAWQRELGGTFVTKRHHIDAIVLTTQRIVKAYKDAVARGLIDDVFRTPRRPGTRVMVADDIGMGTKDIAARAAAAAIFVDLRDRKLLSYLFAEDPENVGAYGYVERALEASTQRDIENSWADIIRQSLGRLPE